MKNNIVSIVGTRPNMIKLSALCKELDKKFNHKIINTGQHYDSIMDRAFYVREPDVNLGVKAKSPAQQTGEIIKKVESPLLKFKPSVVLIYGDTNSSLAGALAASKLGISIAHVEAGVRSGEGIPEEWNRKVIDVLAEYHFCPTMDSFQNLVWEGLWKSNSYLTGDVAVDLFEDTESDESVLDAYGIEKNKYVLATIHRQGNTDDKHRLSKIAEWLKTSDNAILISHPRNSKMLKEFGLEKQIKSKIRPAANYAQMLALERNARAIVTDSGGVQKEAYMSKVPCVVLREKTEWKDPVSHGWAVCSEIDYIQANLEKVISSEKLKPYGFKRGRNSIIKILEDNYGKTIQTKEERKKK